MATYTVIQDVEAEDKFLGPLSLKQFVFGGAGVFFGYLSFFALSQGAAFLLVILLPPMLLGFFLAIPWSSQQSTEVWLLAKFRYFLKPKVRVWNQSGLEELVTITVPKKIEKKLTDGLDQTEVKSRLKALAETIDSRGWATKNAAYSGGYNYGDPQASERLISPVAVQEVPDLNVNTLDDPLDENNVVSENLEHMIEASAAERRQHSLEMMDKIRKGEATNQPVAQFTPPAVSPQVVDEAMLSQQLRANTRFDNLSNSNMRTVLTDAAQPTQVETPPVAPIEEPQAPMTTPDNPDIISPVQNSPAVSKPEAQKPKEKDGSDEIVISLR